MVEGADAHALRAAAGVMLERLAFMREAGITFGGARDLYTVLGYDRIITAKQYRDRYARGGLAKRIVDAFPNATWRGVHDVYEDDDPKTQTAFESAWLALATRLKIWAILQRADKLAGLSHYSVVLIGAEGDYGTELPRGNGTPDGILFLTPFSGGGGPGLTQNGSAQSGANYVDATIQELEQDTQSPRFGLPKTYQLRRLDLTSPELQKPVHWSRVLHIAEDCLDNDVYGIPRLEAVWNLLDDLDKVVGGGAEAFWLRANRGLHFDVDKDAVLTPDEKAKITEQADEYQHQLRRFIQTRKVTVNELGSDVANFANPSDAILTLIAGTLGIPKRILTGSEMGELASSQDRDNWKDQIAGRQSSHAEPYVLRPLIDRLVAYDYLPKPAKPYQVAWALMETLTEKEKADGATSWADTNQKQGTTVFTEDEIRDKWYRLPPLLPEQRVPINKGAAPAAPVAGGPIILQGKVVKPRDLLHTLEQAIARNDDATINAILKTRRRA